ncbi:hypothetical protein ACFQ1M_11695 [Sungkyunkwania multivorans]|uniref:Uncharacterized protein n=1 Tax=Sungkyunkwania multivorans TaxID=1173618 RepID=A0ABW3D0N8_9FLAO
MIEQMHLAAQYLAAAGISFIEKKEDDSHTNLGFSIEEGSLNSRPLNEIGDRLSLNYQRFEIVWDAKGAKDSFQLDGSTHGNVLEWIKHKVEDASFETPYKYDLHYDLPYKISTDYTFELQDSNRLQDLLHFRILTQLVLETILHEHDLDSEIRIWPHHFDTGAFATLNDRGLAVGLGLAIPDNICDDYYLYISGYDENKQVVPRNFSPLTYGRWFSDDFKGAVLPVSKADEKIGVQFFEEAITSFKTLG